MLILAVATSLLAISLAMTGEAQTFPYPTPANHLRVVTWNLEFFNDRFTKTQGAEQNRTSAELDLLAQRIKDFDASVIALQEIDQISALNDLRNRMGGAWQVYAGNVGAFPQQNALLYDASRVDMLSAAYVYINTNFHLQLYPEWTYRSPVTAVFSPKGHSDEQFRVIGIHGHYNDANARDIQGYWLSSHLTNLLNNSNEPNLVVLLGDFNGAVPAAPHNGLISGGYLTNVAKRNGELTTIYSDLKLDYIYVTAAARMRLTDPTAFVVRPEYYGETGAQFEAPYSDHLPVLIDYAIPQPNAPAITNSVLVGTNLVFGGTGSNGGGTYYVLAATDIAAPLANWLRLATNTFDADGSFSVTNPVDPANGSQFLRLQVP
jgi:endonuclease/exonuclease/phosphatase family metal-dependent hydrolase